MKKDIPLALYKKILQVLPVLTVDLVIVRNGKFLLLKRKNDPFKNTWWIPGGRFRKGETFESAVHRITKVETRLRVRVVKLLGVDGMHEHRYGIDVYSIGAVYLVKPIGKVPAKLRINGESSDAAWFSLIPPGVHPFVKKFLREAGFQ